MTMVVVSSPANPRVKEIIRLRQRRHRDAAGVTLVEGFAELSLAMAAGVVPRTVCYCPGLATGDPATHRRLLDQAAGEGAELLQVSAAAFEKLAYRQSPDGWLAVIPAVATALDRLAVGPASLFLVCEAVEKPGNLGAILRTADAAGLAGVIAAGPVTDWGNPNLVRASKGALFTVPVAEGDPDQVLAWLRAAGVRVVATSPDAGQPFTAARLTGPTAIALGSEQHGLSPTWLAQADLTVRIPMYGRVNSLNVAAVAAVLTFEALRQRTLPPVRGEGAATSAVPQLR